ncbi:MAG: HK97 family phage prohead protease, partial [Bergeyella zoohelcum]|nr:HK97 family phage prohead protease [Bergeyella zoohelcum]
MSKKTHHFIVNTEAVNSYGYRILTEGIDTEQYMRNPVVLYMHNRAWGRGNEVIGRTIALKKEGGKLIAEVEFDEADEFAKQIAGKIERGFIKMCSLGADVIETSSDPLFTLAGQTRETVTKCKMVELSIVDIGGNDDALKLSKDGKPAQLQ